MNFIVFVPCSKLSDYQLALPARSNVASCEYQQHPSLSPPLSLSPSPPPLLLRALLPFAPTVRVLRIRLKHSSAARIGLVDLLRQQSYPDEDVLNIN